MGDQRGETGIPGQEAGTFELKDAVTLYLNQRSAVNQLWGIYVVATFAAAGFALTADASVLRFLLPAVLIGFLAFTIGHWYLIRTSIEQLEAVASDIRKALQGVPTHRYTETLREIAKPGMRVESSRLCHVIIDFCVGIACCGRMWSLWSGVGG